jgi:hypothetical protein
MMVCVVSVMGFKSAVWGLRGSPSFVAGTTEHLDYALLPRTATTNLEMLPRVERSILDNGDKVEVVRWTPGRRVIRVEASGSCKLIVRTFRFKGWYADVDGRPAEIVNGRLLGTEKNNSQANGGRLSPAGARDEGAIEVGDIGIPLTAGNHVVTLEYRKTAVQQAGTAVTLLTLGALAIFPAIMARLERKRRLK